jgi:hypothetical protein
MGFYRYVTPVLKGRWRNTREEALAEALAAGQAYLSLGEVRLFEFARLEERQDKPHDLWRQSAA